MSRESIRGHRWTSPPDKNTKIRICVCVTDHRRWRDQLSRLEETDHLAPKPLSPYPREWIQFDTIVCIRSMDVPRSTRSYSREWKYTTHMTDPSSEDRPLQGRVRENKEEGNWCFPVVTVHRLPRDGRNTAVIHSRKTISRIRSPLSLFLNSIGSFSFMTGNELLTLREMGFHGIFRERESQVDRIVSDFAENLFRRL